MVLVGDLHARELAEVDDHAAVVSAEAREAVATAPHGKQEPGAGRVPDRCLHIAHAPGPQNEDRGSRGEY